MSTDEIQQAVNGFYERPPKVTSAVFMCNGDECLLRTDDPDMRYIHGEVQRAAPNSIFSSRNGEWDFEEHSDEEFSSIKQFHNHYGY